MTFELVLLVGVAAAFGSLAVAAVSRLRRLPQRAGRWLPAVFGGMTLATLGGLGLASAPDRPGADDDPLAFLLMLLVGVLVYTVALYLFGDAVRPVSRLSKLSVVTTTAALLLLLPVALVADPAEGSRLLALDGLMVVLLALWTLVHVIVAAAVWRSGGSLTSALARARARSMVVGVVGMGAALLTGLLPGSLGAAEDAQGQAVAGGEGSLLLPLALAALAAGMLWLGFAPPRWLRLVWTQREADRLVAAELAFQHTGDVTVLAERVLPEVCAVTSGTAAWFVYEGEVVAAHGIDVLDVPAVSGRRRPDALTAEASPDGTWHVVASSGDGQLVVRTAAEPVLYGVGDVDALSLLSLRITSILDRAEMQRREEATHRRLTEVRHLERMAVLKDDVLSTLSHELRTPLVTLCGVAEVLDAHWRRTDDTQRDQLITRLRANADHLRRVVEDTLDLASLRTAEVTVDHREVPVRELVAAVLADARLAGWSRDAVLDVPDDLTVTTDAAAVGRVLRQLLANAFKFSPEDAAVRIRARDADGTVRLEVEDRGSGMTPEEATEAFEPFYRSGDVLTRGTRGLGIGLTLARETVRQLGGAIEVRSAPDVGSTFVVVLPPAPRDGAAATPPTGVRTRVAGADG